MPSDVSTEKQARIPMLERDQVTPEIATLYDALLQQRGVVPNMFKTVPWPISRRWRRELRRS